MGVDGGGWLDYVKLRLAKASQLSWSWGLAWLSLAKIINFCGKYILGILNVVTEMRGKQVLYPTLPPPDCP